MDKDDTDEQALFWSPSKVNRTQERLRQKEKEEKQQKQVKEDQRLQQAVVREKRDKERTERQRKVVKQYVNIKAEKERL